MRRIRGYREVEHDTDSGVLEQVSAQRERLSRRLSSIGTVLAVASGKGGVGKSVVTANLAAALARRGRAVGVVDADLNGPSLGRMLGVAEGRLVDREGGIVPASGVGGVRVISMELLQDSEDAPLRWKGPGTDRFLWQSSLETGVLREFLGDVAWGELDYLLIDVPPGTDKILRLLELVHDLPLALVVTIPSEISRFVVSKSIRLVREAKVGAVGLVSNMTVYACPGCGHQSPLFGGDGDGAAALAEKSGLDIWARIPFDPRLGSSTDRGAPIVLSDPASPAAQALEGLADRVERAAGAAESAASAGERTESPAERAASPAERAERAASAGDEAVAGGSGESGAGGKGEATGGEEATALADHPAEGGSGEGATGKGIETSGEEFG